MTSPRITFSGDAVSSIEADVLVLGALQGTDGPTIFASEDFADVAAQFTLVGFSGKADELLKLPALQGAAHTIAVIGLGSEATIDAIRYAAGSAVRQLAGKSSLVFGFALANVDEVSALVEGAALGAYSFTEFKGKTKSAQKTPVETVTVATSFEPSAAVLERVGVVADVVTLVKDLVNTPGAQLYPAAFGDRATEAAADIPDVTVEVWDEKKLAAERCGGIIGIGQGSSRQPRLIKASYSPAGATRHLAFVGKGITFDTGGYSLKPAEAMLTMHHDMGGAAAVLAVTLAAARLKVNVRITTWLCVAENMVSSTAIRVNDVLTMRDGTTVEVINTDAEGRLVMADGLALASEQNPDAIIDIATLTGAAIVSLGRRTAGVMGDSELVARIAAAGDVTGEKHWPMPLPRELRSLLDSKFADMANLSAANRDGGMLVAGLFLQDFVGTRPDGKTKIPWAHLDIAGTGTNNGPGFGFTGDGGTGSSVRTILTLVEEFATQG